MASPGAASYNLKKATSTRGPWVTVGTTSGTVATVAGLSNGTRYYFVVSALSAGGESANSTYVSAIPLALPAAPTGLKATGQAGQVYLAWSAATGALGYNVQRSAVSDGPYTKVGSTTSRAYYDKSLVKGTSFCYVVAAYNKNLAEGPASSPVCAIVQ
jgi:cellulose 1,4-beta-cellobiosidase